ncbi:MAG: hypothetical protein JWR77_1066 [Rhizorhabdus sp.]|nr:hypothetical protein [Rhizorhabdus sp.]
MRCLRRMPNGGALGRDLCRELLATVVTMSMGYIAATATVAVDRKSMSDETTYDEQWWVEFSVRFIRKVLRP